MGSEVLPDFLIQFLNCSRWILLCGPTVENLISRSARNNVKVQMVNDLPGAGPIVTEEIVALGFDGLDNSRGNATGLTDDGSDKVGRASLDTAVMCLGDDEAVAVADWTDVQEGEDSVVLINFGARQYPLHNPAKNALIQHVVSVSQLKINQGKPIPLAWAD